MMEYFTAGYVGLFFASFLSATILPLSSEGILLLMLTQGYDPTLCLLVASIGNSLGGLTNYALGLLGNPNWLKRIGISHMKIRSFEHRIQTYGYWLAFFSWVPFIGDPLSVALGYFRVSFWRFFGLMLLGKVLRYAVIVYFWM